MSILRDNTLDKQQWAPTRSENYKSCRSPGGGFITLDQFFDAFDAFDLLH